MAQEPRRVLQELVDSARELCDAGSAGISLLDPESSESPAQFRWIATSGDYDHLVGTTMPRNFSPCGTVLDRNQVLLMTDPIRHFPYFEALSQPVREVLLVPFYRGSEAIGTVWIAAHTGDRQFDQEDERLVKSVSQFAATAVHVIQTAESNRQFEETARLAAEHELERLADENRRIAALVTEREHAEAAIRRELKDTQLLRDVAARLTGAGDTSALFEAILDAAITITQADAGTIQLLDAPSESLTILASSGFDAGMLSHFAHVNAGSGSPCGIALARSQRTFLRFDDAKAPDADGALKRHVDSGLRCAQSTPLFSRSGESLGMLSTHWREHRELTERELRFLDLLGRQAADLIERARVLEALRASERELREADRRKDEFLAMLAHELRNPLVPIRNGIELLKGIQEHPLVGQVRPMMERQVRHAVHLIDDLLDVSRISSGKIELQRKLITVSALVESAVEANRNAIAAAGLELDIQVDEPDRVLEVDPTRISQVISNILHNATKFTPAGGKITLRTQLSARENSGPPMLTLHIADTGIGILEESLAEIFGLFNQAHSGQSLRHGGLGIGLALAQKLVQMHGGSITAASAGAGQGSEFTVRIPAPAIHAGETAPGSAQVDNLAGIRVLVVDDNQDAADSIGLLIANFGAQVRVAYDAARALDLLKIFDPSLVLLDIGMPDIDGYDACRQIRREKGSGVSIVAVTGWGQESDRRRAQTAGFDAHLTKPVDPTQLARLAATVRTSAAFTAH